MHKPACCSKNYGKRAALGLSSPCRTLWKVSRVRTSRSVFHLLVPYPPHLPQSNIPWDHRAAFGRTVSAAYNLVLCVFSFPSRGPRVPPVSKLGLGCACHRYRRFVFGISLLFSVYRRPLFIQIDSWEVVYIWARKSLAWTDCICRTGCSSLVVWADGLYTELEYPQIVDTISSASSCS